MDPMGGQTPFLRPGAKADNVMNESAGSAGVATNSQLENYYRWVEPDSDITVCLKLETVDRLQAEVLRGMDSSPGAGNEVGGILLGRTELDEGRTLTFVDDFEPVPSEHLNGPSYPFALTADDAVAFEAALARGRARQTPSVVGYYRSHNRGGLFLSKDDLRLIQRYFHGPENLFLVIKTLPNRACTAGFFFSKDGHIQAEFTDSEAPLIPLSLSPARSLLLGEAFNDISVAPPAPVLAVREERPAIPSPELAGSRNLQRRLMRGLVVTGVAAALIVAVVRHRETGPAQGQTPSAPQPVPLATDTSAPVQAPAPVVKQSAPNPSPRETGLRPARNRPATLLRDEPKLPNPAKSRETPVVGSPAPAEPGTPPSSTPLITTAEPPRNTAPPAVETTIAPPVPAPRPPVSEKPVTPAGPAATTLAPRTDAGTEVVPPVSTPVPPDPPASPAAHTFVGPRVIHPVTPAVPRGVGPMITTDVQVDVAVSIDANGKVTGARVASTKGTAAGLLTIEALKAAQLFRFQPAQENSRNIASSMVLTFRFARTAK
jgi:TonB family protein